MVVPIFRQIVSRLGEKLEIGTGTVVDVICSVVVLQCCCWARYFWVPFPAPFHNIVVAHLLMFASRVSFFFGGLTLVTSAAPTAAPVSHKAKRAPRSRRPPRQIYAAPAGPLAKADPATQAANRHTPGCKPKNMGEDVGLSFAEPEKRQQHHATCEWNPIARNLTDIRPGRQFCLSAASRPTAANIAVDAPMDVWNAGLTRAFKALPAAPAATTASEVIPGPRTWERAAGRRFRMRDYSGDAFR